MAFGELTKLIFVKTRDEKTSRRKGEPYNFQIKTNETPSRLATRIKEMYADERQKEPNVFNDDIRLDDTTLKNIVLHLESVNLTATDLDTKGVAFEQFMDGFSREISANISHPAISLLSPLKCLTSKPTISLWIRPVAQAVFCCTLSKMYD